MVWTKRFLKFLHTIATCGIIGGLAVYMVLLTEAPQQTPASYADLRESVAALSDYVLLPSLAVALITGLLSIAVHRPFQDKRWVWLKAAMGILMFKGVLTIVGAKADYAATVSRKIADGDASPELLADALANEWFALVTIMALSVANVILGVWRPRLKRRDAPRPYRSRQRAAAKPVVPSKDEDVAAPVRDGG